MGHDPARYGARHGIRAGRVNRGVDRGEIGYGVEAVAMLYSTQDAAEGIRALAGVRDLQEYLAHLIARRRREPGEDMISLLLSGSDANGDHLDDAELMALCSRFEGPIKVIIRWVVEDHERDGRQIRAGDRVFLVQQSANRDAGTFADPDRFDITRPAQPLHVGFGRGIHGCLGAQLARIEARVALPKILGRLEDIRVLGEVT